MKKQQSTRDSNKKKLQLQVETIRALTTELEQVHGGYYGCSRMNSTCSASDCC